MRELFNSHPIRQLRPLEEKLVELPFIHLGVSIRGTPR